MSVSKKFFPVILAVLLFSSTWPLMSLANHEEGLTDVERCLFLIQDQYEEGVSKAKDLREGEWRHCLRWPVGEEYSSCQASVEKKYQGEVERLASILKQKKRGCMKMPWAYLEENS